MQYWTRQNPCLNCGASSNTGHQEHCHNANLYDEEGKAIPAEKRQVPQPVNPMQTVMVIDGLEIPLIGMFGFKNIGDVWKPENRPAWAKQLIEDTKEQHGRE